MTFSFDGKSYEIDLNIKNTEKMRKGFQFYVDHAQPADISSTPSSGRSARPASGSRGGAKRDYDLVDLRAWAAKEGIKLPAPGRIRGDIIEQYKVAQT